MGEGGSELQWRRKQRYGGTPFAGSEMSTADWVTHHRLNASLSAGTPCCPFTLLPPRTQTEMTISWIKKSGLPCWLERGKNMASFVSPVDQFNPLLYYDHQGSNVSFLSSDILMKPPFRFRNIYIFVIWSPKASLLYCKWSCWQSNF